MRPAVQLLSLCLSLCLCVCLCVQWKRRSCPSSFPSRSTSTASRYFPLWFLVPIVRFWSLSNPHVGLWPQRKTGEGKIKAIPAVEPVAPGTSYNPEFEAHQVPSTPLARIVCLSCVVFFLVASLRARRGSSFRCCWVGWGE